MESKSRKAFKGGFLTFTLCGGLLSLLPGAPAFADEVQMRNGDRYGGKVITLTNEVLLLKSDVLGEVKLPKSKVRLILLGESATNAVHQPGTNALQTTATPLINQNDRAQINAMLRRLASNPTTVEQVRTDLLSQATPEAAGKFNQMLSALMSGEMNIDDLRVQAKSTADQVRALKDELGEDAGWALDGYLAILDNFVRQSAPTPTMRTNQPTQQQK